MQYLEEFQSIEIPEFEEYKKDVKAKAACERYFEKIIEAVISAAFIIVKEKNLKSPESEEQAFFILSKNKILSENLAVKLKQAKDMRNIIIHNYENVEDEIVYDSITKEIKADAEEFLMQIKKSLK